jgi:trigger factor
MTIELGKYKGLSYNRPEVKVLDEEITLFIDSLLEQNKVETDKTGGIEKDDMVLLDFDISHDGEKVPELSRKGYNLKVGNKFFYEDFEARLYGKKAGERINFNMVLPEDDTHNPNADKSIEVDLQIQSVKKSHLPELTDDLVSSFAIKDVNNIEDLTKLADKKIYYNKLLQESSSIINQIIRNILDNSKIDLNEEEIEPVREDVFNQFNEKLKSQEIKLDVYLMVKDISEEEHQKQCREEAITFLKEKAVIEEIGRREDITLNEKEVSPDKKESDDQNQLYYQEVVKFLLKENTVAT